MPRDLGMLEDDMGSIENKMGQLKRPMPTAGAPKRPMPPAGAPKRPMPGAKPAMPPRDLGKLEDDMGSIADTAGQLRPNTPRQRKAAGDIRTAMGMKKGGSVSSASKRADGCATKGKTKGRML